MYFTDILFLVANPRSDRILLLLNIQRKVLHVLDMIKEALDINNTDEDIEKEDTKIRKKRPVTIIKPFNYKPPQPSPDARDWTNWDMDSLYASAATSAIVNYLMDLDDPNNPLQEVD